MIFRLFLLLLLSSGAHARGLVSGGGGGSSQSTAIVTAIVTTPAPCAGNSSDLVGTQWCSFGVTTNGGIPLNNPVYTLSSSTPAGFHGTISGGSLVAGASSTSANTYTATIAVTGSNIGNAGGTFSQTGVSIVVAPTPVQISGVNCSPCVANLGGAQGTTVGTLTGLYTGGTPPPGEVITINNNLSNRFQVTNNILQFGSSPPTSTGTYNPTVTVTNSTASNSPQVYTLTVTIGTTVTTLVTPVTCTAIATNCAGTAGDAVGTSIGQLIPTVSN